MNVEDPKSDMYRCDGSEESSKRNPNEAVDEDATATDPDEEEEQDQDPEPEDESESDEDSTAADPDEEDEQDQNLESEDESESDQDAAAADSDEEDEQDQNLESEDESESDQDAAAADSDEEDEQDQDLESEDESESDEESDATALNLAGEDADNNLSDREVGETVEPCPGAPKGPKDKPAPPPEPPKPGDLQVTVLDDKSGKAITGVKVDVTGPEAKNDNTPASGKLEWKGVKPGKYTANASIDGYAPKSGDGTVPAGGAGKIELKLQPATVALLVDGVVAAKKVSEGGLIVRNFDSNNAPRKKITIQAVSPAGVTGDVIFQCNSAKVKFFDAATAGSEIKIDGTGNKFAAGVLPKTLFAEGVTASDDMRDITISLDFAGRTNLDSATLTILWVDKPIVALGSGDTISANNDKKATYKAWTKANTLALGFQEYNATFLARFGCGTEARGKVHPKKFVFPGNDLKLERDFDYNDFNANVVSASGTRSAAMPPGNDTGPPAARDDNPVPDDTIYDWDAPGLLVPDSPVNTIMRTRNNFLAFASITVEGKPVRCSENAAYFIAFTQIQTKAPHGKDWSLRTPVDVPGDNTAGAGTCKTTWDMK
jgi:hypothetical protein